MAPKDSTGCWRAVPAAALLALGLLAGCGRDVSLRSGAHTAAGAVTPQEARRLIAADTTLLVLDVREPAEWNDELGHLPQARLIPLRELPRRLGEIEAWRTRTILLVSRTGREGHRTAEVLEAHGFEDARDVVGGLQAWRDAGY